MTAIAAILAARLLLLLALVGGFVLALFAMQHQTYTGLTVLVSYCVLTVIPLVYLDLKTRGR